jgi:hypothetical protein
MTLKKLLTSKRRYECLFVPVLTKVRILSDHHCLRRERRVAAASTGVFELSVKETGQDIPASCVKFNAERFRELRGSF